MTPIDLLYIGFFGVMVYSSVLWLLVYAQNREEVFADPEPSSYPGVTFLVPAYNEEACIGETLTSLLNLDYPSEKLEIIAVNDGSTDGTLATMQEFADKITIIDKENTGKANSLNQALERVETELVACMDADSVPHPGFLKRLVGRFQASDVKGVTPALKVRNPSNWVEKVQWTEYVFQIFLRKVFALFDTQYVLPGPGSLYDAAYLRSIGGWDEETLTEDMEVAFRMIASGARLENSANAFVETVPPPTLKALFRQRIRWYRGYMQNFVKYRKMLMNPGFGNLGAFLLPFNVLWIVLIVFFLAHFSFNILHALYQWVNTFLLVGVLTPSFSIGLVDLHFFHLFTGLFVITGVATTLLSLKVSRERVQLWKRKTHYATFLTIYPLLFAAFWVAAFVEHILPGDGRW